MRASDSAQFSNGSKLLIDEHPLEVLPSLAAAIGLNEAIFLQQVHYWLKTSSHAHDGRKWIYNTAEQWHAQFPFWSVPTIRRIITSLRKQDLLIATDVYNKLGFDNTLWYTIDYAVMNALKVGEEVITPCDQNDQTECVQPSERVIKMITPSDQNDHTTRAKRSDDARNLIRPIPETTTETTSEITSETTIHPSNARALAKVARGEAEMVDGWNGAGEVFIESLDEDGLTCLITWLWLLNGFYQENTVDQLDFAARYKNHPFKGKNNPVGYIVTRVRNKEFPLLHITHREQILEDLSAGGAAPTPLLLAAKVTGDRRYSL